MVKLDKTLDNFLANYVPTNKPGEQEALKDVWNHLELSEKNAHASFAAALATRHATPYERLIITQNVAYIMFAQEVRELNLNYQ